MYAPHIVFDNEAEGCGRLGVVILDASGSATGDFAVVGEAGGQFVVVLSGSLHFG